VSNLCKQLDPLVSAWNGRSLRDQRYPFLLVDALVVKVRERGRVRSKSVMLGMGVNEEGYREILGLMVGDSESEASWTAFFTWLKSQDLRGLDLVVSDDHRGLVNAVRQSIQVPWQRCQTHLMRNLLDAIPKALQAE
jgi:putative transposase